MPTCTLGPLHERGVGMSRRYVQQFADGDNVDDIYLVGGKDLSNDAAYAVVKALWENNKDLAAAYSALAAWRPARMVSKSAFIPYHPGAIRFFKEKGVWDKNMDELQAKLLAQ